MKTGSPGTRRTQRPAVSRDTRSAKIHYLLAIAAVLFLAGCATSSPFTIPTVRTCSLAAPVRVPRPASPPAETLGAASTFPEPASPAGSRLAGEQPRRPATSCGALSDRAELVRPQPAHPSADSLIERTCDHAEDPETPPTAPAMEREAAARPALRIAAGTARVDAARDRRQDKVEAPAEDHRVGG